MNTALLIIALTAAYLLVIVPLLLRLMRYAGDEPQVERIAEDSTVKESLTAAADVPLQNLLDAYELTDLQAHSTDMERI